MFSISQADNALTSMWKIRLQTRKLHRSDALHPATATCCLKKILLYNSQFEKI